MNLLALAAKLGTQWLGAASVRLKAQRWWLGVVFLRALVGVINNGDSLRVCRATIPTEEILNLMFDS
jgi:hypothetical protein